MKEISGDVPLSWLLKFKYLAYNLKRGILGMSFGVKTSYWNPTKVEFSNDSPGRKYINNFLETNFPLLLKEKQISVLDIGCGSGYVRKILAELGYGGNYVGVDVVLDRFKEDLAPAFKSKLDITPIEEFNSDQKFDLTFSMTSLEHIPDNITAVAKAKEFTKNGGLQIHIVPSFWALFLYLYHGFRQYTPKYLKELFKDQNFKIYRLGGLFSFLLHFFYITIIERLFRTRRARSLNLYKRLNQISAKLDKFLPFCSSIYVVVIE